MFICGINLSSSSIGVDKSLSENKTNGYFAANIPCLTEKPFPLLVLLVIIFIFLFFEMTLRVLSVDLSSTIIISNLLN